MKNIHLNILVFGPQLNHVSTDVRIGKLQNKRKQIRLELEELGHFVRYAEDLCDPNLPSAQGIAFFQEIIIMREFDLIVNLVETPGSIVEAATIACKPDLARKTSLFLNGEYLAGLVASSLEAARFHGADVNNYRYPEDLDECHLLGQVIRRVEKAQFVKLTF